MTRLFESLMALSAITAAGSAAKGPAGDYDYSVTGQSDWGLIDDNLECSAGKFQSPINISTKDTTQDKQLGLSMAAFAISKNSKYYEQKCEQNDNGVNVDADCETTYLPAVNMQVDFPKYLGMTDEEIVEAIKSEFPNETKDQTDDRVEKAQAEAKPWNDAKVSVLEPESPHQDTSAAEGADEEEDVNRLDLRSFNARPAQVHLHSPSEHTIDSFNYDVEIHFVNQYDSAFDTSTNTAIKSNAVVGVFFDQEKGGNEENKLLKSWLETYEDRKNPSETDFSVFKPDLKNFYHYKGSLTTPPCTQNVEWFLLKEVQSISEEQLKKIQKYTRSWKKKQSGDKTEEEKLIGNNRLTQSLNSRLVFESYDPNFMKDGAITFFAATATPILALAATLAF